MEQDHLLCMGCMAPIDDSSEPCPICGTRRHAPSDSAYLAPGTVLAGRYLVGRVAAHDAESVRYIGFDTEEDARVWIREFFPAGITRRSHTDQGVLVKTEMADLYADWLRDFTDLMSNLQKASMTGPAVSILDRFAAHHTVYVVERYFQQVTFGEFLSRSGGTLRWPAAKKLFMPLFAGLSHLHAKGVVHGGICPENLLIDLEGRLWLWGFSTRRLRTGGEEGLGGLYPGYSSLEQYNQTNFQGSWTDVYAMAAVLYRTLTGTRPPSADERTLRDNLTPVAALDGAVPQNVSDAIAAAMTLNADERSRTVDDFTAALLESTDSNTAVFEPSKVPVIEEEEARRPTVRTIFKLGRISPGVGYFMIAAAATFLLVGASLGYLMTNVFPDLMGDLEQSSMGESSLAEEASDDLYDVPSFVGVYEGTVRQSDAYVRLFTMTFNEAYNEEYPAGVVFRQEPMEGARLGLRQEITVWVSKGSEMVTMPNLVGSTVDFAIETLAGQDIRYTIEYLSDEDEPGTDEHVILRTDKIQGTKLRRFSDTVTLYVKDNNKATKADDET